MNDLNVTDQGSGTPVVWIHGFPLSSLIFQQQLDIPGVRHLAPDLPGFGGSAPAPMDSIDDFGRVVLSVLERRGVDRAVIAGVSMGGYVALSIVRQRPEVASALVLIDTREGPDSATTRATRYSQIERVSKEGPGFFVDEMLPRMLTRSTLSLADRRTEIVRQAMLGASSAGVREALRTMATRPDSSNVIRTFSRPILVVVGSEDDITPPTDARRMAALGASSSLIEISDAAHLSNVERPTVFNDAVRDFLDDIG